MVATWSLTLADSTFAPYLYLYCLRHSLTPLPITFRLPCQSSYPNLSYQTSVLTIPDLAQGANSSIEDGAVLGYILSALQSKDELPSALRLYERLRKKRCEAIVRETFAQRLDFHMEDGPEQQARDELMLSKLGKTIDSKFPIRWQCPQIQPWLYGYDARQDVESALREWPLYTR